MVHAGNTTVHISCHAVGELISCYFILKPFTVMPVHGEYRNLVANVQFARHTGIAEQSTIIDEDGTVIDLLDGTAAVVGQLHLGFVYIDGSPVGEIIAADLKGPRILGEEGFISIIVLVEAGTGHVVVGPEIHAKGFAQDDRVFSEAKPCIAKVLEEAVQNGASNQHPLSQSVRRVVGRWVNTRYCCRR